MSQCNLQPSYLLALCRQNSVAGGRMRALNGSARWASGSSANTALQRWRHNGHRPKHAGSELSSPHQHQGQSQCPRYKPRAKSAST